MRAIQLAAVSCVLLLAATTVHAVVLCAKPRRDGTYNTSVKIREACKDTETQLDAAQIGVQGEPGPQGEQGPEGPQGPQGPVGPAGDGLSDICLELTGGTPCNLAAGLLGLHSLQLARADLQGVDLANAFLARADLVGANLDGADLSGAELNWAHIEGASLVGADLTAAQVQYTDFTGADLTGAAVIPITPNGIYTRYDNANLDGATLTGGYFDNNRFVGANLDNVVAIGARFSASNLTGATFANADLSGVIWSTNNICPDGRMSNSNGNTCCGHHVGDPPALCTP